VYFLRDILLVFHLYPACISPYPWCPAVSPFLYRSTYISNDIPLPIIDLYLAILHQHIQLAHISCTYIYTYYHVSWHISTTLCLCVSRCIPHDCHTRTRTAYCIQLYIRTYMYIASCISCSASRCISHRIPPPRKRDLAKNTLHIFISRSKEGRLRAGEGGGFKKKKGQSNANQSTNYTLSLYIDYIYILRTNYSSISIVAVIMDLRTPYFNLQLAT